MWRGATSSQFSRDNEMYEAAEDPFAASPASLAARTTSPSAEGHDADAANHPASTPGYMDVRPRVAHTRNDDSVISLFSDEDIDIGDGSILDDSDRTWDDRASRSASDDSSEDTALASRPRYRSAHSTATDTADTAAALSVGDQAESGSPASSLDDLATPGLHTAGMAALHFGHSVRNNESNNDSTAYTTPSSCTRPSASGHRSSAADSPGPAPITLASYLSSTLSSPKTRSISSGSLASFPTDFLSDASRAESVADTDDGGWELYSDAGGHPSSSASQVLPRSRRSRHGGPLRDSSDLVMPKLVPTSVPDSPEFSSPSDSDKANPATAIGGRRLMRGKQESASSTATLSAGSHMLPRVLMAGGTVKQQAKVRAALSSGGHTPGAKADYSVSSVLCSYGDRLEAVESLAAACERAERPFTVLQTIIRPEIQPTDASLLETLLPNLLEQVAAVSVCLLILDVQDGKTLAQHVLEQFRWIHELAKFTSIVPVLVQADDTSGRDSVSQLTQGSIDWLGKDREGKLASLRSKARPYSMRDLGGLASAITSYDFRASTVKSFQRWNNMFTMLPDITRSNRDRRTAKQADSQPLSIPGSPSFSAGENASAQMYRQTQELPSLASSMLDSVTLPPSSLQSGSSASSQRGVVFRHSSFPRNSGRVQQCYGSNMDPLHLPSLVRLVGLNLAASFAAIATTIKSVFLRAKTTEEDMIRKLLEEDDSKIAAEGPESLSTGVRAFSGCCRLRYTPSEDQHIDNNRCRSYGGILFAGIVIGFTLWFS